VATGCLILELNPVKSPLAIDGVSQGNRIQSRTSPASNSGNFRTFQTCKGWGHEKAADNLALINRQIAQNFTCERMP
jgi:hypothetical protein